MKKTVLVVSFILLVSMLAAACSSAGNENGTAAPGSTLGVTEGAGGTGATETPFGTTTETITGTTGLGTSVAETPMATATQALSTEMPTASVTETGGISATQTVSGTAQIPSTGAQPASHTLSSLFGYSVYSQKGDILGTASDYILNLCEAHILYIVLRPTTNLGLGSGEYILIPYEAVSVNNGQIMAAKKQFVVNVTLDQLKLAPTFTLADLDMSSTDWENTVMSYWGPTIKTSLTTECKVESPGMQLQPIGTPNPSVQSTGVMTYSTTVSGTVTAPGAAVTGTQTSPAATQGLVTVHKIALAKDVLTAAVQEGNGTPLGQVEEVLVTPQTGRLDYVVVQLGTAGQAESKLVLVPLRALNIAEPGANPVVLVLLVDTNVLQNAPAMTELPKDFSPGWDKDAFDYWSQYVQMTRQ